MSERFAKDLNFRLLVVFLQSGIADCWEGVKWCEGEAEGALAPGLSPYVSMSLRITHTKSEDLHLLHWICHVD